MVLATLSHCSWNQAGRLTVLGLALTICSALGVALDGPTGTISFCLLLLIVGMPHGALDIERLKTAELAGRSHLLQLLALYVGLAGAMLLVWQISPVFAMAAFLMTSALHFSEDWEVVGEPFLSSGTAVALLTAPTLLHAPQLREIFIAVTGSPQAASLADGMLLFAPVSLGLGAIAILTLWQRGWRANACVSAVVLIAMTLLPPIAAFALFFCAYHSPLHLREVWTGLDGSRMRLLGITLLITSLALLICAVLVMIEWRGALSDSLVAATFMTLSILTVPHMLAPPIARRWLKGSVRAVPTLSR